MRHALLALVCLITGCSNLAGTRGRLLDATRTGVADVKTSIATRGETIERYQDQTRARLDAAFDADVREAFAAGRLDAKWTLDARRAYALGVDALATQRRASAASTAADLSNLAAIEAALVQIKKLDDLDRRWLSILKGKPDEED